MSFFDPNESKKRSIPIATPGSHLERPYVTIYPSELSDTSLSMDETGENLIHNGTISIPCVRWCCTEENLMSVCSQIKDVNRHIRVAIKTCVAATITRNVDAVAIKVADRAIEVISLFAASLVVRADKSSERVVTIPLDSSVVVNDVIQLYLSVISYSGFKNYFEYCDGKDACNFADAALSLYSHIYRVICEATYFQSTAYEYASDITHAAVDAFREIKMHTDIRSGDHSPGYLEKINCFTAVAHAAVDTFDGIFEDFTDAWPRANAHYDDESEREYDQKPFQHEHSNGQICNAALSVSRSAFALWTAISNSLRACDLSGMVNEISSSATRKMAGCCAHAYGTVIIQYADSVRDAMSEHSPSWEAFAEASFVAIAAAEDSSVEFPKRYLDIFRLVLAGGGAPKDAPQIAADVAASITDIRSLIRACINAAVSDVRSFSAEEIIPHQEAQCALACLVMPLVSRDFGSIISRCGAKAAAGDLVKNTATAIVGICCKACCVALDSFAPTVDPAAVYQTAMDTASTAYYEEYAGLFKTNSAKIAPNVEEKDSSDDDTSDDDSSSDDSSSSDSSSDDSSSSDNSSDDSSSDSSSPDDSPSHDDSFGDSSPDVCLYDDSSSGGCPSDNSGDDIMF